jgi:capsular exopolysaccharide synthesis family protein
MKRGVESALRTLRRQKWIVALIFAAVVGLTAFYSLGQPDVYQAASLLILEGEGTAPDSEAINFGFVSDPVRQSPTTQLLILEQAPEVAERAAERVVEVGRAEGAGARPPVLGLGDDPPPLPDLAERVRDRIDIVPQGPEAFVVAATSTDPGEAALLANAFAEAAVDYARSSGGGRVGQSREFLQERVAEAAQDLARAESALEGFMGREGAVGLDQEVSTAISNQSQLESRLSGALIDLQLQEASLEAKERELDRVRPALARRLASSVGREKAAAEEQLGRLEARLEDAYRANPELRAVPTGDPRARAIAPVRRQIEELRQRVADLSERYVAEGLAAGGNPDDPESGVGYAASLEREVAADRIAISGLRTQIAELRRQIRGNEGRLGRVPGQTVGLGQLERELAAAEQRYARLDGLLQEAVIAGESEIGSLRLLRAAEVPDAPVPPRTGRNLTLGGLLGLLLGLGAAVVRGKLDTRLRTPDEVRERGLQVLSTVPDMTPLLRRSFPGKGPRTEVDGREVNKNLVALTAPFSAAAEAYRHLYTRIQLGLPDRVVQTVLVTSAEAGAGKSTTALNLALTAARARRRTLIVDADMRRPSVRRYLGLGDTLALEDLIAAPGQAAASMDRAATGVEGLWAVTVREPVADPLEYLTSGRTQELVQAFRGTFDLVVFDTPPLLLASDAVLLSTLCDASVLVASAGQTDVEALDQVSTELSEAGARTLGVVLNRFDPTAPGYKHTYGYRQRHYSAYHQPAAE